MMQRVADCRLIATAAQSSLFMGPPMQQQAWACQACAVHSASCICASAAVRPALELPAADSPAFSAASFCGGLDRTPLASGAILE